MADHKSNQAAVSRAIAQEAAAAMRETAVESRLGVPLNRDMLFGFRRVLLKLGGDKALSSASQKALQAFPLAYTACSVKEAGQMNGAARDTQMTKSLVEFAIPNFLLQLKAAAKQLDLPLPPDVDDKIFKTTLGTVEKPAMTFAQSPATAWLRFSTAVKTSYTRDVQAKLDMGPQSESEFESGKNSQDYLDMLLLDMWLESSEGKKAKAIDISGSGGDGDASTGPALTEIQIDANTTSAAAIAATRVAAAAPGAVMPGAGNVAGATEGETEWSVLCECGPPGKCIMEKCTWDAAHMGKDIVRCPQMFEEGVDCGFWRVVTAEDKQLMGDGRRAVKGRGVPPKQTGVPKDWFFPYILLACDWSPWSGRTPGEWKNLCASSGKAPKTKASDQINVDQSQTLASPSSMAAAAAAPLKMNNDNGDSTSRRKNDAAVKAENDRVHRATRKKENMDLAKVSIDMKKKGVAAMNAANANAVNMVSQLQRIVELKEKQTEMNIEEAAAKKRKRKIEALEKRMMLSGGVNPVISAQLDKLLSEECDS